MWRWETARRGFYTPPSSAPIVGEGGKCDQKWTPIGVGRKSVTSSSAPIIAPEKAHQGGDCTNPEAALDLHILSSQICLWVQN